MADEGNAPRWHSAVTIMVWQAVFWGGILGLRLLPVAFQSMLALYFPIIVIVASATLAFVALALLPLTRFDPRQWTGAAFLLLIAADAAFTSYSRPDAAFWRYAVQYLAIASGAAFVAALTGPRRWTIRILQVLYCLILGVLCWADRSGHLIPTVRFLDPVAVLAVAMYVLAALLRLARKKWDVAIRTGAVLLLGIAAMTHDIGANLAIVPAGFLQASTLFPLYLVVAVALELGQYGFSVHRRAQHLNMELKSRITFQEAEISQAAKRLREQEDLVAVSLERQRLVRDMHDGAGGLLTRLLLRLRNGNVPLEQVHEEIQAAVDDLRQIIDSMDCADEGLDVALAIFRERVTPRLASEGITLRWTDEAPRPLPAIGSQRMIQIYRILQEGITNTVRHGQASIIDMRLTLGSNSGQLMLTMTDDGVGFLLANDAERPRWQRGLTNMSRRARMIGGNLEITTGTRLGTRLRLWLPD